MLEIRMEYSLSSSSRESFMSNTSLPEMLGYGTLDLESSSASDELVRRMISSHRDGAASSSARLEITQVVRKSTLTRPVGGKWGGGRKKSSTVGPKKSSSWHKIHEWIPTKSTLDLLLEMHISCGMHEGLDFLVPRHDKCPWTPPPSYICLYESFFLQCNLWFPLPDLVIDYCVEQRMVISQLWSATWWQ